MMNRDTTMQSMNFQSPRAGAVPTTVPRRIPVLVPTPLQTTWRGDWIRMPVLGRLVAPHGEFAVGSVAMDQLHDEIVQSCGLSWDRAYGERWDATVRLDIDAAQDHGSYVLDIGADNAADQMGTIATVSGGDAEGLRCGVQTLRQIIRQCAPLLPCVHIEDKPVYAVRGYYLDVTRGRVPTMDWLKAWADKLAFYKYNQLQLYIEHSFAFDGLSEAWRGADPLTPSDILEYDAYCARLGIELVPSVSTFGHHYMTLRTHDYRDLGEFPQDADRSFSFVERQEHHTLNITDPRAFGFSTRLIDEYAPLFRSRQFNIGADETFDLGKGRSKTQAERVGVAKMYADYVMRLCQHVTQSGRTPMFWGDIAVEMPEILDALPHDAIVLNWLYAPDVTEEKVKLVADAGATQYVCPAVQAWNGLLPRIEDAWKNISRLSKYGTTYGAQGIITTDWGDYGHVNDPRMSIPGMIYGAQCSWTEQQGTFDEINQAISRLEYADPTGTVVDALAAAANCKAFGWDDLVRYLELDDGHGGLNADVAATLPQEDARVRALDGPRHDLDAWRDHALEALAGELAETTEINRRLDCAADALAAGLAGVRGSDSARSRALLIAVEGQRLLNEVGVFLAAGRGIVEIPDAVSESWVADAEALARRLERWWEQYRDVWRGVSRESELARISGVIWQCADMLRTQSRSDFSERGMDDAGV